MFYIQIRLKENKQNGVNCFNFMGQKNHIYNNIHFFLFFKIQAVFGEKKIS